MKTSIPALVLLMGSLTACGFGESNYNPMNWFSSSTQAPTLAPEGGYALQTDPRPLVQQVSALKIDRTPGGAIIRATGLPQTQGYWAADLIPINGENPVNGVLTYEFHILPPLQSQATSTEQSRKVVTAYFVSNSRLDGVREIKVVGLTNSRSARR